MSVTSQLVSGNTETAIGTITTQNTAPNGPGTAPAGSTVELSLNGCSTLMIQTRGTYTGALSLQGTLDGNVWVTLGGTPLIDTATGTSSATIASAAQSIYQADVGGLVKVRISANAAVTGSVIVILAAVISSSVVGFDQTGTMTITSLVPGVTATSLGKAEDAIAASGDTGVFVLGVRRDGPTLTAQTAAGDYNEIAVDIGGAVYTRDKPLSFGRVVADGQIKGSAGAIHTITIAPTGTPVAGVLTVYDSLTETGTVIFSCALPASVFTPFTVTLDVIAATGIFVGFDATLTNTQVTVAYI